MLRAVAFVLGVVVAGGGYAEIVADPKPAKAPKFTLEDQFGKSFSIKFPRKKLLLLTFGDQAGSQQIGGWTEPIEERYAKGLVVRGVAQLDAVPKLARLVVKQLFKKDYPSVMLDWTGEVSKDYKTKPKVANIFVVDMTGTVLMRCEGKASKKELAEVFALLDEHVERIEEVE